MKAIILISEASLPLAKTLQRELPDTLIYTKNECEGCISITSCHRFIEEHFNDFDSIIFIGAMGICVRSYNPQIQISAESETKRSIFREKDKTKRSKKESAQHSKSRNKSFVMTSVSAL